MKAETKKYLKTGSALLAANMLIFLMANPDRAAACCVCTTLVFLYAFHDREEQLRQKHSDKFFQPGSQKPNQVVSRGPLYNKPL